MGLIVEFSQSGQADHGRAAYGRLTEDEIAFPVAQVCVQDAQAPRRRIAPSGDFIEDVVREILTAIGVPPCLVQGHGFSSYDRHSEPGGEVGGEMIQERGLHGPDRHEFDPGGRTRERRPSNGRHLGVASSSLTRKGQRKSGADAYRVAGSRRTEFATRIVRAISTMGMLRRWLSC